MQSALDLDSTVVLEAIIFSQRMLRFIAQRRYANRRDRGRPAPSLRNHQRSHSTREPDSVRLYQSIVCRRTRKLHARQHRLWPATELSSSPTDAQWSVAVGLVNEKGSTPEARDGKIKNEFPWGKQWPPSKRRRKLF